MEITQRPNLIIFPGLLEAICPGPCSETGRGVMILDLKGVVRARNSPAALDTLPKRENSSGLSPCKTEYQSIYGSSTYFTWKLGMGKGVHSHLISDSKSKFHTSFSLYFCSNEYLISCTRSNIDLYS